MERPTKSVAEITQSEYKIGRAQLKAKIEYYRPKVVCFVGKGVYQQYSGRRKIIWGKQPESIVDGVIDFVAPSSSGLVRMNIQEIINIYRGLLLLIEEK